MLTAVASSTAICAGNPLNLTATAAFPSTRRMRNPTATALPDGATAFTALPVYSTAVTFGSTLQRGLENAYRNYSDLTGVRVRLAHAQPGQVALRLAVLGINGTTSYLNLAPTLPTASGSAQVVLDLTFATSVTTALPATVAGSTLMGTF